MLIGLLYALSLDCAMQLIMCDIGTYGSFNHYVILPKKDCDDFFIKSEHVYAGCVDSYLYRLIVVVTSHQITKTNTPITVNMTCYGFCSNDGRG